ncbi:MAG: response regulator [Anaerolineae bacterium]|nr:response regulator [Anaerolineae bacterium]
MPAERILVADDTQDVLDLCTRILGAEGYQVVGVRNGLEAVARAQEGPVDLFLTDVVMPGVQGLKAAQAICEIQPECVVVIMTGFGTLETALQAMRLGFSDLLIKPFRPPDLTGAVSRALERARLRSENQRLRALVPLFELNKTIMAIVDEGELAAQVLQTARTALGAQRGVLVLYDREPSAGSVFYAGDGDLAPAVADRVREACEQLRETEAQLACPSRVDASPPIAQLMRDLDAVCLLFCPLRVLEASLGALVIAKGGADVRLAHGDRELLTVLSGQASIALQNARLFQEIQQAYRELQMLDHMKTEFINIAAHELRTPLAILMGHTDMLLADVHEGEVRDRLQIILRNATRLRTQIDTLLDMRTLGTGEARLRVTSFALGELIDEVIQDLGAAARGNEISIARDVPDDLPLVQSDRTKIHYALANLLDNAIRFTPQGGMVGIDVDVQPHALLVAVWDTGIGIPESEFEHIFRPFYQVEESLTRYHEGMGLGLAIAKGMVELCGGRIWVESTVGKGSRFTFTIPR